MKLQDYSKNPMPQTLQLSRLKPILLKRTEALRKNLLVSRNIKIKLLENSKLKPRKR